MPTTYPVNQLRVHGELSDLFFNHQHTHYPALFALRENKKQMPPFEEIRDAIHKDALEFVASYPITCNGATADQLTYDFMERL